MTRCAILFLIFLLHLQQRLVDSEADFSTKRVAGSTGTPESTQDEAKDISYLSQERRKNIILDAVAWREFEGSLGAVPR